MENVRVAYLPMLKVKARVLPFIHIPTITGKAGNPICLPDIRIGKIGENAISPPPGAPHSDKFSDFRGIGYADRIPLTRKEA